MTGSFGRWLLALFLAAAIPFLQSCGGGGGDSGGGGGNSDAFTVSPSSISFTATQGPIAPTGQMVTVTVLRGSVFFGNNTVTQNGGFFTRQPITFPTPTTVQFFIQPETPFTPGTFTGSVTVRGCSNPTCSGSDAAGSPKIIPITYTVTPFAGLTITPANIDFVTRTGALPAAKTATLAQSSGSALWTSVTNYTSGTTGWLGPMSGTLNPSDTVTFNVTDASTAEVREATVTFTAGAFTKTVPVSLVINDPRANFVSPYVVPANSTGNVIIRGYGFSTLTGPIQVLFGATPATTAFVSSDTEIGATFPALGAGSYPITVKDASTTLPSRPSLKLVAINAPAYSAVAVSRPASPGTVVNLIYDGERQALYLLDANNRIERYTFVAGTTWNVSPLTVGNGGFARMALAPDGTQLVKTNGASPSLEVVDPVTLSSSTVAATFSGLPPPATLGSIAFANDGGAVGSANAPASGISLYRYDMLTQRFTSLSTFADLTNSMAFASGDGDTLILPTFDPAAPAAFRLPFIYDATAGTFVQGNMSSTQSAHFSLSRDAVNILRVIATGSPFPGAAVTSYTPGAFTLLGTLPAGLTGFVISPDGFTAYAHFSATNLIRKFDLTAPSGGSFVETGSILVASPGTSFNEMTISPDGGTLFLAGNQQVVIVPAP